MDENIIQICIAVVLIAGFVLLLLVYCVKDKQDEPKRECIGAFLEICVMRYQLGLSVADTKSWLVKDASFYRTMAELSCNNSELKEIFLKSSKVFLLCDIIMEDCTKIDFCIKENTLYIQCLLRSGERGVYSLKNINKKILTNDIVRLTDGREVAIMHRLYGGYFTKDKKGENIYVRYSDILDIVDGGECKIPTCDCADIDEWVKNNILK